MIDLLDEINTGNLSYEHAQQLLDDAVDATSFDRPWNEEVGFSKDETAAYMHGASLEDLVTVRYRGWPSHCFRCGQTIDRTRGGWMFHHRERGGPELSHVVCPNPAKP